MDFYGLTRNFALRNDYSAVLIFSTVILSIAYLWKPWNIAKRNIDLPTYHWILYDVLVEILTTKVKSQSFGRVLFQKLFIVSKRFQREGMYSCWLYRRVLVIYGEEATKIFATSEASADKSSEYECLMDGIGDGLLTSNGEKWKRERKLLNPAFSDRLIKNMIPTFNENASLFVKKIENLVDKPYVDLAPYLHSCAFHNACETVLDIDVKKQEKEGEKFYEIAMTTAEYMMSTLVFPVLFVKFLKIFTSSGRKFRKDVKEGHNFLLKEISAQKEAFVQKSCDKEQKLFGHRQSVAQILVQHHFKDSAFNLQRLLSHMGTFSVAASDSIGYTTMWCLFMMGLHKDIQQRAYEEVESIAGEFITYDDLRQMEYLECVMKETLRIYPTVPAFARRLTEDVQCGKYLVPKNTTILFLIYSLHRNPEIYPDPEKFDPDRFYSVNAEKRKWAHLPFSEGYRSCIGKSFAMTECKVTLAYTLRNYEITSLDKREDLVFNWNPFLSPIKPLRMRLAPRKIQH